MARRNKRNNNNNNSNKKRRDDGTFTQRGAEQFGEEGGEARKRQIQNDPNQSYEKLGKSGARERWGNEDSDDNR